MGDKFTWTAAIAAVAIFVSYVIFCLGQRSAERARKIQLTMDLWQMWTSTEMRNARVMIGNRFTPTSQPEDKEKTYSPIGYDTIVAASEPADGAKLGMYYGNIAHFIMEMGALKRAALMNDDLCHELFHDPLVHWCARFSAVEFGPGKSVEQQEHRATQKKLLFSLKVLLAETRSRRWYRL